MPDNVAITAGSGTNIATDEVSGTLEHVQLFKLAIDADGSRTLVPADATNGLRVRVSNTSVPIGDGTNVIAVDTTGADAESNTGNKLLVQGRSYGFNGTTWDRVRSSASTFRAAQYTTAQTGVALWTPAAGRAVVVTALQIQSFGTTAGLCQVWFGGAADTTYTRGTDAPLFDGEFAPSATNKPGLYITYPTPMRGTADFVLRVTTTNAQSLNVNVWGYEI